MDIFSTNPVAATHTPTQFILWHLRKFAFTTINAVYISVKVANMYRLVCVYSVVLFEHVCMPESGFCYSKFKNMNRIFLLSVFRV